MPSDPTPPVRRPIQWGRAPQTVFRAGPLPSSGAASPRPAARPLAPRPAGILSGSLIPTARAAPPAAPAPSPAPVPESARPTPQAPLDLTIRPLPEAPSSEAAPVLAAAPAPTRIAPEPAVSPRLRTERRRRGLSPVGLAAGVAGLVLAAGAGWLALRPAPTAPPPVAPFPMDDLQIEPSATVAAQPVVEAPVETVEASAPVVTRDPPPPPPAAAPPRPEVQPAAAPPRIELAPAPVIEPETAPVVVAPPPTQAETPATDPDAPIATRPQPLD